MPESITKNYQTYSVENDSLNVQIYQLANGLTLYLSVNKTEARIHTNIAVRAGSKNDPSDTTGLAHYMEHMLFKGTSKIGTIDWDREKELIDQISNLFEQHRQTTDEVKRKEIYAQIDLLSSKAAQYISPNEYDRLTTAIGAKGTNAYTWLDQTVYVNNIPANELERWMELESERFKMMALRLFHTELETVYEEFNISQDKDFRKANNAIRQALFPKHPYGTQTTLGSAQHLKNPSLKKIQAFFKTYYVPNNMGIMLAGDFDPQEAIALAEKYFGNYQSSDFPTFSHLEQPAIKHPIIKEVTGREAAYVELAWRLNGSQTDDPMMASLIRYLLYNDQAGLLDANLNQKQLVLESEAWSWTYADYSVLGLFGKAREGQSLEEVKDLLLHEIQKIKNGEFEDWLLEAVLNEIKIYDIKATESNNARINAMTNTFILGIPWKKYVSRVDWLKAVTKEDIVAFAKANIHDGYVLLYKQQGEDDHIIKVEKPTITPVELQRDNLSDFAKQFLTKKTLPLKPEFVNFKEKIQTTSLSSGIQLDYVYNPNNSLFRLDYILDMGKTSSKALSIALLYAPYLGTTTYSPSDFQKELFRLGLSLDIICYEDRAYLTISGLEENFEKGLQLMEHFIYHLKADQEKLDNIVSDILIKRENAKKNRNFILKNAMMSFARYGAHSSFTDRFSEEELKSLKAEDLTQWITDIPSYEHRIYYFGQNSLETVTKVLEQNHSSSNNRKARIPKTVYEQLPTTKNTVLFLDFPIVQVDVMLSSKLTNSFELDIYCMRELFNEYFGLGLSSVVFQEIREARAFAYSTYAMIGAPREKAMGHYFQAYVGTQPDKLQDAVSALQQIIQDMPVSTAQIENARHSLMRKIESERLTDRKVFWEAQAVQQLGYDRDLAQDVYHQLENYTVQDILDFYKKYVQNQHFTYLILGDKKRLDMDFIQSLGEFKELTLTEVFGH